MYAEQFAWFRGDVVTGSDRSMLTIDDEPMYTIAGEPMTVMNI